MIAPELLFAGVTSEHSPVAKIFRLVNFQPSYETGEEGVYITLEPRCDCEHAVQLLLFVSTPFLRVAEFQHFITDLAVILANVSHNEEFMGLKVGPDPEVPFYSIDPFAPDIDTPACSDTGCSWTSSATFEDLLDETEYDLTEYTEDDDGEDPDPSNDGV